MVPPLRPSLLVLIGAMIISVGALSISLSMAAAQKSDTEMGTIASVQNGKDGKPAW